MGKRINNHPQIITDIVISAIMNIGYNKEMYVTELSKALSITYSHTLTKIVPKLAGFGLIEQEKNGRKRVLRITQKGLEVYKRLGEIGELLGDPINESGDRRLDLIVSKKGG